MNEQQLRQNLTRRADGVAGAMAGVKSVYTFQITGQTVLTSEQVAFFNTITDVAISANHALLTPVQTPSSGWTLAQIADYFTTHIAPAVNMNISNVNNPAVIASMSLYTIRRTPDGKKTETDLNIGTLLTSSDFQPNRVQAELTGDIMFDAVTYPRLAWNSVTPAAIMQLSWSFGANLDLRENVGAAPPVRI